MKPPALPKALDPLGQRLRTPAERRVHRRFVSAQRLIAGNDAFGQGVVGEAAPRDAWRLRYGSVTSVSEALWEACQAKAAKIAHTDQCTVGAGLRASRRMIALGHASRLVDFVGVPPALLLESKNPSRSTFSTRAL